MLEFDKLYRRIPTAGVCYYCGDDAQTGDHVPPISTVRKRKRDELLWLVPSCQRCNNVLGTNPSNNLKNRRSRVLKRRLELGDNVEIDRKPRPLLVWIMPPLNDEDRDLIGKVAEAMSGSALVFINGRLGGDFRRSVLEFESLYNSSIGRGIVAGILGRALREEHFIWGFGQIPSMHHEDPRPVK